MPDVFGLDIAGIVADAIDSAGGLPTATLIKVTPGTRTPGSLTGGTNATQASYETQGIVQRATDQDWGGNSWEMTRRERATATLIGKPLTDAGVAPEVDDLIVIDGVTWIISGPTDSDPAKATYTLMVTRN